MPEWIKLFLKVIGIFLVLLAVAGGAAYLTLRILIPPENIEVPQIVGKKLDEAVIILSKNSLSLRVTGEKYSAKVPPDVVISQVPSPGVKVRKDRSIEVVISKGKRAISVPCVIGMELREAKVFLSQKGLKIGYLSYIYSSFPQDEIVAQDPSPNEEVSQEEGINLLISLGFEKDKFYMPNLIGRKIERVKALMEAISLNIGKIKESSSGKEGIVISQVPSPGSIVTLGEEIELTVGVRSREKKSSLSKDKWIFTKVRIPLGLEKKKVKAVILDKEGRRIVNYGWQSPGKDLWITSRVRGKGEIRVYINDELFQVEKVEE